MAIRFRKRIKIAPGIAINLGKTGVSASIGKRGATVNIKPGRKSKTTMGIPGTGVSATEDTGRLPFAFIGAVLGLLALLYLLA